MAKQLGRRLLACWGNGDFGRLGHGPECLGQALPRVVASLTDSTITGVSCGSAHTVALDEDGSVYTTGLNDAGQLGHSHEAAFVSEAREILLPEATAAVAAGSQHTLMLAESGDVWAVGSNSSGQLGLGKDGPEQSAWPRRIPALAGSKVVHIAAGADHSLAVTEAGEVLSWGAGARGQLGHGNAAIPKDRNEHTPRLVMSLKGSRAVSASGGLLHSGCSTVDGNIYMWGDNRFWQLGVPVAGQSSEPVKVDLRGVEELALSGHHTMALRHTGELFAWGANEHGVLGLGREARSASRQPTPIPRSSYAQIACGWKHCAAVTASGRLFCWGWGGSEGTSTAIAPLQSSGGQLGLDSDFDYWDPTQVELLSVGGELLSSNTAQWKALQVSCGLNHTAAVVEVAR